MRPFRDRTLIAGIAAAALASASAFAGNGAPPGAHYNLNVIGVENPKSAHMTGNAGHRIFVPLDGNTKIWLTESPKFRVNDANGTDGGASFGLPNPDSGGTEYAVYARAVGAPGGGAATATCAFDQTTTDTYCSTNSVVLARDGGKSSFTNVANELLYVYADFDGDGVIEREPLFSDAMLGYYWNYDNHGSKVAQLRFYEIPSDSDDEPPTDPGDEPPTDPGDEVPPPTSLN